jgi:hypothetical protein
MTGTETSAAAGASQNEIADVLLERLIDSEYKIWKKNTPYLYVSGVCLHAKCALTESVF